MAGLHPLLHCLPLCWILHASWAPHPKGSVWEASIIRFNKFSTLEFTKEIILEDHVFVPHPRLTQFVEPACVTSEDDNPNLMPQAAFPKLVEPEISRNPQNPEVGAINRDKAAAS